MEMNSENSRNNNLFLVGMILSMFCWGLSWSSGKILASYGDAPGISLYRFFLTFISLLIILLIGRQKILIQNAGLKDLFLASVFMTLYSYFFFKGLSLGNAGAGGVMVTTLNPIVSYAIKIILEKKRPSRNETAGLVTGLIAGAILLRLWNNSAGMLDPGNLYFLLASFTWAILSIFTAKSSRYGSPVAFSLWLYGICSFLMLLLSGISSTYEIYRLSDLKFWSNLFFSATITTGIATTIYFVATARVGASKASSFIFLVPFSAALGSFVFLDEVIQIHTIAGGLLGIVAVYLINRK
jgi:drug/metabolite transporter (DMT)-like permease